VRESSRASTCTVVSSRQSQILRRC
jgi:hypothetical protein